MFSIEVGKFLTKYKEIDDITFDYPELNFDYLGIKEKTGTIDLIGFMTADDFSEAQILETIERFYHYIAGFKKDLLFNKVYKPNAVICFVFEKSCRYRFKKLLPSQSKIDHSNSKGRVLVPWIIDVSTRKIIPHKNPVSWFPPTRINHNPPLGVYPGKKVLDNFLIDYIIEQKTINNKHKDNIFLCPNIQSLVTKSLEYIEKDEIKEALILVRSSLRLTSDKHTMVTILSANYERIVKQELKNVIALDEATRFHNKIVDTLCQIVKGLEEGDLQQG